MSGVTLRSSYALSISKIRACTKCGAPYKDHATLDVSVETALESLPALIEERFNKHIPNIPVGWSCNGRDETGQVRVWCPKH